MQGIIMFQHWWFITAIWFVLVSFLVAFIFDKIMSLPSRLSTRRTSRNNDSSSSMDSEKNSKSNNTDSQGNEADRIANSSVLMAVNLKRRSIKASTSQVADIE